MNEDGAHAAPREVHSSTTCAPRKDPFANIEVGCRATAIGCIGNVAYWERPQSEGGTRRPGHSRATQEAMKHRFRPYRKALGPG